MLENGTGSVPGNEQNVAQAYTPRTYSSFPLKAHRFNTERFAEYTPIIALEATKNDKLPLRLAHNLMSYTMSAPLMQDITKYKELFSVPMESILPLNWEKFFDNPVRGDDVPTDVGPTIENAWNKIGTLCSAFKTGVRGLSGETSAKQLQGILRFLVLCEYFYSNGSLLATLNCHGSPYLRIYDASANQYYTFDQVFDMCIDYLIDPNGAGLAEVELICDGVTYYYRSSVGQKYHDIYVPFRHLLCLMRDDPTAYVNSCTFTNSSWFDTAAGFLDAHTSSTFFWTFCNATIPLNTQFLSAYQLACAHYYTNDHVDFIYSAELFRQLIGHYLTNFGGYNSYFTRNGIQYQYDYLSAHAFSYILTAVAGSSTTITDVLKVTNGTTNAAKTARAVLGFFSSLFAFRRSLKYMDYFSGSRVQPLAVGNGNVSVTGTNVSVIDITVGIQRQRFRNAVNRVKHSFEGYLQAIFGGDVPAPDYHNPFDLARTADSVFGDQTNNTASEQMQDKIAITTNLRAQSNNYMFEIRCDRPCVIIAITYYDILRVHPFSMDRSFFHVDRFDYFNPFFQYTGDQPVYTQELGIQPISQTSLQNFGYQLRNGEYKQLYSTCAGGFLQFLPGFIFPAIDRRGNSYTLSPEWIRSINSEFDNFYNSLTGWSNASYFHFIVDNYVDIDSVRPMATSPQILG